MYYNSGPLTRRPSGFADAHNLLLKKDLGALARIPSIPAYVVIERDELTLAEAVKTCAGWNLARLRNIKGGLSAQQDSQQDIATILLMVASKSTASLAAASCYARNVNYNSTPTRRVCAIVQRQRGDSNKKASPYSALLNR